MDQCKPGGMFGIGGICIMFLGISCSTGCAPLIMENHMENEMEMKGLYRG